MNDLIESSKGSRTTSLATLKPKEIVDFVIEETDREWKQDWLDQANQISIFDYDEQSNLQVRKLVDKLPYNFYYRFLSEGDVNPRKLRIEDWEIGALYWNCLRNADGDEQKAKYKVTQKYLDEFTNNKDLHFFLGTTKLHHYVSKNPFMIIGVYYPPLNQHLSF